MQAVRVGGTGQDYANALALDGTGTAVVGGSFQGTVNFGGMPLTADGVTSAAFVTRLNLATST